MGNIPDNSIIESQSINILKPALQRCHRLKAQITENDKTLSWDGTVEVYHSDRFSKSTLDGIVSVQVKGKWCDEIPKNDTVKFYVSTICRMFNRFISMLRRVVSLAELTNEGKVMVVRFGK